MFPPHPEPPPLLIILIRDTLGIHTSLTSDSDALPIGGAERVEYRLHDPHNEVRCFP
jgi:hypothetical protein